MTDTIRNVAKDPFIQWSNKMPLQASETQLSQVDAGQTRQSFWQFSVQITGLNGTLYQEVTIDLVC